MLPQPHLGPYTTCIFFPPSISLTHKTRNGLKAFMVTVTKKLVVAAKLPKQNHWQPRSTLDMGFIYAGSELQFLLLFQEAHG